MPPPPPATGVGKSIQKLQAQVDQYTALLKKEKEKNEKLKHKITDIKTKKASRRSPNAPRVKRSMTTWVQALKEWNKDKDHYKIPKKGTPEYQEVINIKNGLKVAKPEPEPQPSTSSQPSTEDESETEK